MTATAPLIPMAMDAASALSLKGSRGARIRPRRKSAPETQASVDVNAREPTRQELLEAVRSLSRDQLRPYGRILRKRLTELCEVGEAVSSEIDVARLRMLCSKCDELSVEDEGEADWSATIAGEPAEFVDIYSSEDNYTEELWSLAAAYFEGLREEEMNFPGGRYICAQGLAARNLHFLAGHSLGQVCHIVQIAMTQRKLLGYRNGAIVPYGRSQTMVKEHCAEKNQLCRRAKMPLATWDALQKCLSKMLLETGSEGLPLSNVKRLLRANFQVDLSETSLGHSTVSELFKDPRMQDVCRVRLFDNGYFLFEASPEVAAAAAAAPLSQDKDKDKKLAVLESVGSGQRQQHREDRRAPMPSSCVFSFGTFAPVQPQQRSQPQPEETAWDLMCSALGMVDERACNGNEVTNFSGCFYQEQSMPPQRLSFDHAASSGSFETDRSSATDVTPEGAFNIVAASSNVVSDEYYGVPALDDTALVPSSFLHSGLVFPSLIYREEGSEAGSSLATAFHETAVSSSASDVGSADADAVDVDADADHASVPPTPYVAVAMTPSPFVHCGGTFNQMLFAAAAFDDAEPGACFTHVDKTSASHSFPVDNRPRSLPPTPFVVLPETPSPFSGGTFAQLMRAEMQAADVTFDRELEAALDRELARDLAREMFTKAFPENVDEHVDVCSSCNSLSQDVGIQMSDEHVAEESKQRRLQAIQKSLDEIAQLESRLGAGQTLSKIELANLDCKSDLELEAELLANFSFDDMDQLDDDLSDIRCAEPAGGQYVDNLWKALPRSGQDFYGRVGATVRNTFIEIASPSFSKPSARATRCSRSVPRSVSRGLLA